jgi:hypothetical protein
LRRGRLLVSPVRSCGRDEGGKFFDEIITLSVPFWFDGVIVIGFQMVVEGRGALATGVVV